jgi:AAA-like domain/CHAT domain
MNNPHIKKILVLAANPKNSSELRLGEEAREIDEGLRRSRHREQFEMTSKWAVRVRDFYRHMLDIQPTIVHFFGHGIGEDGIVLEDETGEVALVQADALAGMFKLFASKGVECVLLNACYSEVQAEFISQYIPYVVGMNKAIGDEAAINFAVAFYDALGAGETYDFAFELGRSQLIGLKENETPVFMSKSRLSIKGSPGESSSNYTSVEQVVLEEPEGQVGLDSPFYVERPPIEADCYETIVKPGTLIRIKAPRQMGKSSLMSRILHYGINQGHKAVTLYFQEANQDIFRDLDKFLQWFCASITSELDFEDKLEVYWKGGTTGKNKCTKYFERYLLHQLSQSLILGLDEVDLVFQYPEVAHDFFGMLRAWHERAKNEATWKNLKLVIVHSKEVYIPLNINQSPFNVGLAIELPEFNYNQIQDLLKRHGLSWTSKQVEELMALVGGHPYLIRVALYQIARGRISFEQLLKIAPTEEGLYSEHLCRHLYNLQENERLLLAIKQVVRASTPVRLDSDLSFQLRSMGLVKLQGNDVIPTCNLYRLYFCDRLRIEP